jgi:hypothetical protein
VVHRGVATQFHFEKDVFMSMMLYGAGRLVDAKPNSQAQVLKYWQDLAGIHFVHLIPQMPTEQYLEDSVLRLWGSQEWLRFCLAGIADGKSGTSDHFLLQAAQQGEETLKKQPTLTPQQVWTRVPQWRFLCFMFWHGLLTEAYLVIEHTSGDAAKAEDQKSLCLTDGLLELWCKYCWDMSCEDPSLYHLDLSLLPR